MKNREEGDCPTYSLFYAKVQLCSKNNFSPCSKHFGVHSHINKNMINTAQLSRVSSSLFLKTSWKHPC